MNDTRRRGRRGRKTPAMMMIARKRVEYLLRQAEGMARCNDLKYMRRYVHLAWKISTRYNVRIPQKYKRWICRGCDAYLLPGVNATVRIRRRVTVKCLLCGTVKRYVIKKGHDRASA